MYRIPNSEDTVIRRGNDSDILSVYRRSDDQVQVAYLNLQPGMMVTVGDEPPTIVGRSAERDEVADPQVLVGSVSSRSMASAAAPSADGKTWL
jgi:hypothetical protein